MISRFKAFFEEKIQTDSDTLPEHSLRLASAALLVEVATIDQEFDDREFSALQSILQQQFGLSEDECASLSQMAEQECAESTSVYQFTRLINDHCSAEEKFRLVEGMWQIAYADGDLDKYEEYIIRKVSELIHLAHGDFIRAKHNARQARGE